MLHKKLFKTLVVFATVLCGVAFAHGMNCSDGVVIIIREKPNTQPERPRNLVYVPFYAELTNLGVFLVADSDWGDATVTLYSLEGDYYQTTFDMADVSIMLPVNGNVGDNYTLTISVENGLEYEGEFYL